jgi:hypothetical protein
VPFRYVFKQVEKLTSTYNNAIIFGGRVAPTSLILTSLQCPQNSPLYKLPGGLKEKSTGV